MTVEKRIGFAAFTAIAFGLCTFAWAEKESRSVTPASANAEGFAVVVKPREGGMLRFTVTRDISKAHWPARSATLAVRAEGRAVAMCPLEGKPDRRKSTVTYWFDVARAQASASSLTITEIQTDDGKPDGEMVLGGGAYYEFRLAEFAPKPE